MADRRIRSFSFYLIALAIPIIILVGIEGILRALDYGKHYPLFVDTKHVEGYLEPNQQVIHRFFPSEQHAPAVSPDTQYFLKDKPENSIRIVVQGGSTAAGFPFGRWGSLSGMLQQRFKRLYPEHEIEVINTAMASVNSYTLLDFVDEIIAIEPDAVLIYAGHNEYLGVMGVGSAYAAKGGRAATLLYLKLKELRLYRLLESTYYQWFSPQTEEPANSRTLMAKVAKEKDIPLGSELYQLGVEQFSGNMQLIVDKYAEAGIPVVIGTLASNEADHIPFSAIDTITPQQKERWYQYTAKQRTARIAELKNSLTPTASDASAGYFELGHLYLAANATNQGRAALLQAKDADTLRFRAPEDFNKSITSLAKREGVYLADVQNNIIMDSKQQVIGSQHMLEHLHPTARGYFMLADAYLAPLQAAGILPEVKDWQTKLAWQEMPVTKADNLYAQFKVARLTADYPFTREKREVSLPDKSTIEGLAVHDRVNGEDWLRLNRKLSPQYQKQGDLAEGAKIAGLLADALPHDKNLAYLAGLINKKANNLPFALYYFTQAMRLAPDSPSLHLSLAQTYFMLERPEQSLEHLQWVKQSQPNHPQVDQFIERVTQMADSQN